MEEFLQSQPNLTNIIQSQPIGIPTNQGNIAQKPVPSTTNGAQTGNFQNRMIPRSYSYSSEHLHRMQMFYCSAMNRLPGLFAKSKFIMNIDIFFDKGQKKSIFIN